MLENEIEKIIRDFDYTDYGLHFSAKGKTHEWPPVLAHQIAVHVGKQIAEVVRAAQGIAL